jgi:hypothetical protein
MGVLRYYQDKNISSRSNIPSQFLITKNITFSIQPPIQWIPGAPALEVKRPGRESDHAPPSSAEVKNAWSYTSTPPIRLHGVVLSSAQRQLYLYIYEFNNSNNTCGLVPAQISAHYPLSFQRFYVRECIQKFPYWPPGARTANGTALCH